MDKLGRILLLYDLYGTLLTENQQRLLEMFYHEDLSLGEISEINKTSRQAVFDTIKRSEKALEHYEEKLGLLTRNHDEQLLLKKLQTAYDNQDWAMIRSVIDLMSAEL